MSPQGSEKPGEGQWHYIVVAEQAGSGMGSAAPVETLLADRRYWNHLVELVGWRQYSAGATGSSAGSAEHRNQIAETMTADFVVVVAAVRQLQTREALEEVEVVGLAVEPGTGSDMRGW
jgi:hypothetical protein